MKATLVIVAVALGASVAKLFFGLEAGEVVIIAMVLAFMFLRKRQML